MIARKRRWLRRQRGDCKGREVVARQRWLQVGKLNCKGGDGGCKGLGVVSMEEGVVARGKGDHKEGSGG